MDMFILFILTQKAAVEKESVGIELITLLRDKGNSFDIALVQTKILLVDGDTQREGQIH